MFSFSPSFSFTTSILYHHHDFHRHTNILGVQTLTLLGVSTCHPQVHSSTTTTQTQPWVLEMEVINSATTTLNGAKDGHPFKRFRSLTS